MTHQFYPDPSPESSDEKKIEERNFQNDDIGQNIAMLRQIWNGRRLRSQVKEGYEWRDKP